MRKIVPILLAVVCATPAHAVDYYIDPLTEGAFPGRGSQGGSFGAGGWTTTGGEDAVWYEVPDALETGNIEFSVTGVSTETTLTGADHDIFAMYQAPTDMGEPCKYNPWFRNNDFKAFTRLFGQQEPDRAGAFKLEFVLCPRGEPWHHDVECPADCGGNQLSYAFGKDEDIGWDPNTAYRIRLAWGSGTIAFYRDGVMLGDIQYEGTYAPKPLRVRLGSPRHGVNSVAVMPIGLTFFDVAISGEPGTMTPICGAPVEPPDAGPPADDVGPPGSAGELSALQDVTAASWSANAVYSEPGDLNVEASDSGDPTAIVYLLFPEPNGVVTHARLRLRASDDPSAKGGAGVVHPVADTTWSESTMTWSNKPPYGAAAAAGPAEAVPGAELEWDVTSLVAAGTRSFALVSNNSNGAHYLSKESGGAKEGPRLYVETIEAPPPGPEAVTASEPVVAPDTAGPPILAEEVASAEPSERPAPVTDAAAAGADTGGLISVGTPGGDLGSASGGSPQIVETGGCGCRAARPSSSSGVLLLVALFAILNLGGRSWVVSPSRSRFSWLRQPPPTTNRGRIPTSRRRGTDATTSG